MDTRREQGRIPDAIVVVNGLGMAVDCNNAFAQLCGTPAGMLVGQSLSTFAPELASTIDAIDSSRKGSSLDCAALESALLDSTQVDSTLIDFGDRSFELDVQPFVAGNDTGDLVIRLRSQRWHAVA